MATLVQQLNSQNHWLADGVQTIWNFSFAGGYINRTHVKAYKKSPAGVRTDIAINEEEDFVGDFQLSIIPAVEDGYTLVIYRDSSNDGLPLVDFADGAIINEGNLDIVAQQSVFMAEESRDFVGVTTSADLADLASQSSANAAAAAASASNAAASATAAATQASGAAASASAASASASAASGSAANAASAATTQVNLFKTQLADALSAAYGPNLVAYGDVDYTAGVGKELRRVWYPERKGAVGNGVANDTAAINNAIDALSAAGGGKLIFTKTYLVKDLVLKSNVHLIAHGGRLVKNGGLDETYIVKGSGTLGTPVAVSGSVAAASVALNVTSTTGLVAGGWALLRDNQYVSGAAGRNQEIVRIESIVSLTVNLKTPTLAAYTNPAELVPLTPLQNVVVDGFDMSIPVVAGGNVGGHVLLALGVDCQVRGNKLSGSGGDAAVGFDTMAYSWVFGNSFEEGQNQSAGGFGYGIQFNEATHNCIAAYNISRNIREHTFTNRTRFCEFSHNMCHGHYDSGFNTHGAGVTDCLIADNLVDGTRVGAGIAVGYGTLTGPDQRIDITGNTIRSPASSAIAVTGSTTHRPHTIRVTNNSIDMPGTVNSGQSGIVANYVDVLHIAGNHIRGGSNNVSNGVFVANATEVGIDGNRLRDLPNGYGITLDTVSDVQVMDNDVRGAVSYNLRGLGTCTNVVYGGNTADDNTVLIPAGFTSTGNSWDRFTGSATYDPPSLVDGAGATTTVTCTGCALGDHAVASFSLDLQGITLTAWVSAANTVSVRFQNESGGTVDLASGTLRVRTNRI